jgi:hypothetical protein
VVTPFRVSVGEVVFVKTVPFRRQLKFIGNWPLMPDADKDSDSPLGNRFNGLAVKVSTWGGSPTE